MTVTRLTQPEDPAATAAQRECDSQALWDMTAAQRERAMWAGQLTMAQLCEWSSRRPDEVPKIGNEFAWIMVKTPEWADASESARRAEELAA